MAIIDRDTLLRQEPAELEMSCARIFKFTLAVTSFTQNAVLATVTALRLRPGPDGGAMKVVSLLCHPQCASAGGILVWPLQVTLRMQARCGSGMVKPVENVLQPFGLRKQRL
jgi:hypothetical protein